MTICFLLPRCTSYSRKDTKKFWSRIPSTKQNRCCKYHTHRSWAHYHRYILWTAQSQWQLYFPLPSRSRMYHILHQFCTYLMSIYWWHPNTLCWSRRVPWMEYSCDNHYYALYYPRIRRIFSQSSYRWSIFECSNTCRFPDTLYCRTFYRNYRVFYWCSYLSFTDGTLCFDWPHG